MTGPAHPSRGWAGRSGRPPIVVVAWVGLLGAVFGLGLLGQVTSRPTTSAARTDPVAVGASPEVLATPVDTQGSRVDSGPARATRPPIGEDGVMGGLVFGTAWHWLEPLREARP